MPGVRCCVIGCKNSYYNRSDFEKDVNQAEQLFSMYCFPKDPVQRKLWAKKCKLTKDPGNARVCLVHFSEEQFETDMEAKIMGITRARKLKQGAVPDRRLGRSTTPESKKVLADGRKCRLLRRSVKKDINNILSKQLKKVKKRKKKPDNFKLNFIKSQYNWCNPTLNYSDSQVLPTETDLHKNVVESDDTCTSNIEEPEHLDDCLKAVGLMVVKDKKKEFEDRKSDSVVSDFHSVEAEMERMFLSQDNLDRDTSNNTELSVVNCITSCSNCDSLRHENQRLKLQLAFFKSKLSHIVDIYHRAEEATLNQVKNEFQKQLVQCHKANAELTFNNTRYLTALRSALTEDEFRNRISNCDDRQHFSNEEMSNALQLRNISQEAYLFVKSSMNLVLPEPSSLNNYQNTLDKSEND